MTTPSLTMPTMVQLHTPAWQRGWEALLTAWSAARSQAAERRQMRATLRAISSLDDATRRDLGLPERSFWPKESSMRSSAWLYY